VNLEATARLHDAACRANEAVTLALLADPAGNVGRWVACRLSDGGTDGVVYDHKLDAARHQLHPLQCMYVLVDPMGLPVGAAAALLSATRRLYDQYGGIPVTEMDIRQSFQG